MPDPLKCSSLERIRRSTIWAQANDLQPHQPQQQEWGASRRKGRSCDDTVQLTLGLRGVWQQEALRRWATTHRSLQDLHCTRPIGAGWIKSIGSIWRESSNPQIDLLKYSRLRLDKIILNKETSAQRYANKILKQQRRKSASWHCNCIPKCLGRWIFLGWTSSLVHPNEYVANVIDINCLKGLHCRLQHVHVHMRLFWRISNRDISN